MFDIMFGNDRKQILSWAMYDWANSAFATTVMAAILPIYYSKVAASMLTAGTATIYWSYTITIALIITAVASPVIGAISDHSNRKKFFIKLFVSVGVAFTTLLYFIRSGDWLTASLFFIVANVGFTLSEIFYNSLLKFICKPEKTDEVSTFGYALGYLGGGILLVINMLMFKLIEDSSLAARLSFVSASVWWAVFTIPLLMNVNEPLTHDKTYQDSYIKVGFSRLASTFKNIRVYKNLFLFLIAFWIYSDGIGTIIKLAIIYGTELGINSMSLIGALIVTQFVGIPCTLLFSKLSNSIGVKNSICFGLAVYALISFSAYFISSATHFWILAVAVGTVQGGTQALSRSFFCSLTPKNKTAEFFGFYSMSSKFAGIVGPLVFASVSQITGNSRVGVLSLVVFFVAGIIAMSFVKENDSSAEQDL